MAEFFPDQLASRQQNARGIGWKRVEFCDQSGTLLLGYPPVQDKQRWNLAVQGCLDGIEMFGALGQHQHFSTLTIGVYELHKCARTRRLQRHCHQTAWHRNRTKDNGCRAN